MPISKLALLAKLFGLLPSHREADCPCRHCSCYCHSRKGTIVDYINQVLASVFEPGYQALVKSKKKPIDMEDNAAIHTSTEARLWRCTHKMDMLVWPPSSPDLNPDENMWRAMKQRIKRYPQVITKQEDLWQAATKEWDRLVADEYHIKCIETLPERMKEVIKNRGFATRW